MNMLKVLETILVTQLGIFILIKHYMAVQMGVEISKFLSNLSSAAFPERDFSMTFNFIIAKIQLLL